MSQNVSEDEALGTQMDSINSVVRQDKGNESLRPAGSPATIEPGFPQGDAKVYAVGFTYNLPQVSFDVGYSLHKGDSRGASHQELQHPTVTSQYASRDQAWAGSIRWRF